MVEMMLQIMRSQSPFTYVIDAYTTAASLRARHFNALEGQTADAFQHAWDQQQRWGRWFLRNYYNAQTQQCIVCQEAIHEASTRGTAEEQKKPKPEQSEKGRAADHLVVDRLNEPSPVAQRNALLAELRARIFDETMTVNRQLATYPKQTKRLILFRCNCLAGLDSRCFQEECSGRTTQLRVCTVCKVSTQLDEAHLVLSQSLLPTGSPEPEPDRAFRTTARFTMLLEHVAEKPPTDKIVVFSRYHRALLIAQRLLDTHNVPCLLVGADGSGVVQFRRSTRHRVLLVPLLSGNYGLNLQVANHVIFLEPPERWDANAQAIGRVHRFGQLNQVVITHIVARGTHEEQHYLHATKPANREDLAIDVRTLHTARSDGRATRGIVHSHAH